MISDCNILTLKNFAVFDLFLTDFITELPLDSKYEAVKLTATNFRCSEDLKTQILDNILCSDSLKSDFSKMNTKERISSCISLSFYLSVHNETSSEKWNNIL